MSGRYLIHHPGLAPDTFLFFFYKGSSGRSFSTRDFRSSPPILRRAGEFPPEVTAESILDEAIHAFPAEAVAVTEEGYWLRRIEDLNRRHLSSSRTPLPAGQAPPAAEAPLGDDRHRLLDPASFAKSRKSRKPQDVHRMLSSPQSEDWVTWNVSRLLERRGPDIWWPVFIAAAEKQGSRRLQLPPPTAVDLWRRVSSPPGYEAESRQRMARSESLAWRARSADPRSVEGDSEIDLALEGGGYLIFVEAKVNSDVAATTRYDPDRNQIVRNIDCLLEERGDREPIFWMLVKDRRPDRLYVQIMDRYRHDPEALRSALPHRPRHLLEGVAQALAIITWAEVLDSIEPTPEEKPVYEEILRRVHQV